MSRCYKYAIARLPTDGVRNETLNLALVVLREDRLEVRLPKSLDKVRAITAALSPEDVRAALERLPEFFDYVREAVKFDPNGWTKALQEVTPCSFSSPGEIFADSEQSLSRSLDRLIVRLVEPEPAPSREMVVRPTRLLADLKLAFRAERVLAKRGESLDEHRIVANHKIAEGLSADLILKNGAMHIIQSADASGDMSSPRRAIASIAVSTLVFEQARMKFGEVSTSSRLVYKASSATEALISPSLDAAEHQGASLINWESRDDKTRFLTELSSLAHPIETKNRHRKAVHASAQHRLKLN